MPSSEPEIGSNTPEKNARANQRFSLTRVHTAPYPDAASVFHPEGERERLARGSSKEDGEDYDDDTTVTDSPTADDVDGIPEVRGGIADERDVEKGDSTLQKEKTSRSTRSTRDPNEVRLL